jgi:conjugal transfer pilus assembly protein TraB
MSLQDRWDALSPGLRRGLVLGGAAVVVIGLAALLVRTPKDERAAGTDERRGLITNLLTDADPRAIGIEGLAERLRRVETQMGQLAAGLDKLGLKTGADPERDALIEGLRQENGRQLEALRAQQEARRKELAAGSASPALPPAEVAQPPIPVPAEPAPTQPPPRAARPLSQLFEPSPDTERGKREPMRLPPAGAETTRGTKALAIRVVAAEHAEGEEAGPPEDAVLIPAGSILRGVLLSGMDAPTGRQSRRDPYPALARIKHDAILPNRFRADVRECFLVLAGYGDLGSERAYLRSEAITCVRADGGAIEVPIDAYATGEDGKVGVRGRVVSKQGKVIAQAMMASFVDGFSKMFSTVPVTTLSTATGQSATFQSVLTPDALQGAAVSGAGSALDRLTNFFMDMAEEMFPVIEIDAGRAIELVLNRGATLSIADAALPRKTPNSGAFRGGQAPPNRKP